MMNVKAKLITELIADLEIESFLDEADVTAEMVSEMYAEVFRGTKENPSQLLRAHLIVDPKQNSQLISLNSIGFASMCEHHFLPFFGYVDISYVPNGKFVGIGQLTRLVKVLMKRPQLQEKMTEQIATIIETELTPNGVGVHIIGKHFCELMRGTEENTQLLHTLELRGILKTELYYHQEFVSGLTSSID